MGDGEDEQVRAGSSVDMVDVADRARPGPLGPNGPSVDGRCREGERHERRRLGGTGTEVGEGGREEVGGIDSWREGTDGGWI